MRDLELEDEEGGDGNDSDVEGDEFKTLHGEDSIDEDSWR